jgi:hypothetical protein
MCKNHFCNPSYRDIHSFVIVTCCSLQTLILSFVEAYLHLKELYQLDYGFHIQKQIINITHIKNQWILHMQTHVCSKMQS